MCFLPLILAACSNEQGGAGCDIPACGGDTLAAVLFCETENIRAALPADSIPSFADFIARLNRSADSLKGTPHDEGVTCADAILDVVYRQWGIQFDADQDNLQSLLPHTVVERKKGSCLGVSLLMLMLAERTNCPLYGVVLPGHFFVRLSIDTLSRNIEPNRAGFCHPDAYYRQRYDVNEGSWYDMRNLTKKEACAVFYFNLGNMYRQRKRMQEALRCYHRSAEWLGGYAEAWGNMAIAFERIGKADSARAAFDRALEARPDLPNLALNRGAFELRHKRYSDALAAFRQGLAYYPDDAGLYRGMAAAYRGMGRRDSAYMMMSRIGASGQAVDSARRRADNVILYERNRRTTK